LSPPSEGRGARILLIAEIISSQTRTTPGTLSARASNALRSAEEPTEAPYTHDMIADNHVAAAEIDQGLLTQPGRHSSRIIDHRQGADILLGQVVDDIGKIGFGRTITTARSLTWLARISQPCPEAMQKQEVEEVGQHHRRR
jgi:hypothetical protein